MDISRSGEQTKEETLLYAIGYAASRGFAPHFQSVVEEMALPFDLAAWLHEWTEYDSDAGFGHMDVQVDPKNRHGTIVTIKRSFLTHGADAGGSRPLCQFMVGYIEGLLKEFSNSLYETHNLDRQGIKVHHDPEVDCYRSHLDQEVLLPKSW